MGFYAITRDKDKLPLFRTFIPALSFSGAKTLATETNQNSESLLNALEDYKTRITNILKFILAGENLDLPTFINEYSEEEQ